MSVVKGQAIKMTTEKYSIRNKSTELSVANNTITGIKKSDTVKTGIRVYDRGCIGVAGAIGAYDEGEMAGRARHMLKFNIPYDCQPAGEASRSVDLSGSFELSEVDFVRGSEELLGMLSRNHPNFAFNHKIIYEESEERLSNDLGADYAFRDKVVQFQLLFKSKGSKNLMDCMGVSVERGFDLDIIYKSVSEACSCYDEKVDAPEEKMPVVFLHSSMTLLMKFLDLSGRAMGTGASLFSGKIGEKLFSDDFSLCVQRDPAAHYASFFDAEGTVLDGDNFPLIDKGVLKAPFSGKKIAKQYGYPVTGSASAEYDSVPDTSHECIGVSSGTKTISELLGGRKAIYIVFASGGDFTAQGEFASPVQSAFLFDGRNLLGRLPQLSIRSNVYDMFGKDYIGQSTDGNSPDGPFRYLAVDMHVSKIGDWF